jgi:hypothetical protein
MLDPDGVALQPNPVPTLLFLSSQMNAGMTTFIGKVRTNAP